MTNKQKSDLQWKVRYYLGKNETPAFIIKELIDEGFHHATIKKYIKAFSK